MLDIGAIVWGVQDVPRSVAFWSKALNYRLKLFSLIFDIKAVRVVSKSA